MGILKIKESKIKAAAISATAVYLALTVFFFLPFDIPHKITPCVSALFIASLWLCPWQISLALLFSALGDHFGSCGNFLAQMGFFALGHIWFIVYFISRYFKKVEPDRKLTGKAKGYLAMVIFCATVLLCVVFFRIVPLVPPGVLTIGVSIYAILICTMLVSAMLQRSSLFALGAILFVFSDFILAWNKFVEPVPYRHYLVLVPYFLAQWLLFIRATKYRIAPEMRLMRF
ncbi:MAG: lysoplasmalogenase [Bacteroidales bacterium]|nr:lysoplasmalogenase [Bacteroidales bacterium]MBQ8573311.1 lysoplasmalogenase [Bacteroidales bacterium]